MYIPDLPNMLAHMHSAATFYTPHTAFDLFADTESDAAPPFPFHLESETDRARTDFAE